MRGRVRREPARRLLELALARDAAAGDAGVVPGDRDVYEPLVEVALGRLRGAPRPFESLVSREVLAAADEVEPELVGRLDARFHAPRR